MYMILRIIPLLTLIYLKSFSLMAADMVPDSKITIENGGHTVDGINIGDVRRAIVKKDVDFFNKKGPAAAMLIAFHKTLTGEYGILEMMFRELKNNTPKALPALLEILFALHENDLFLRINDPMILYKLAPDIKHIADANTKLFFALEVCGVTWGKTDEFFRNMSDYRYAEGDTPSFILSISVCIRCFLKACRT